MNARTMVGRLIAALFFVATGSLFADVKMPAIFGDHMVLQQDTAWPVWGTADAGEKVTVTIGSSTGSAEAGADGKWMVKLTPLPAGATPLTMTVTGKNSLKFDDVLVGDVWVCSGQSNMEFGMNRAHNATTEIPKANDPLLRLFLVVKKTSLEPQSNLVGKWVLCTPDDVKGFTAVGYFFGRELRSHFNRPIGLIGTYWGGTPAQAWTSIEALKKEPALKNYADQHEMLASKYSPQVQADFDAKMAAYLPVKAKWDQEVGTPYKASLVEWNTAVAAAKVAGQPAPPKPEPTSPAPMAPTPPDGGPSVGSNLFNGMIAPLIPYAIKGVIWYQGESNAGRAVEYRTLFGDMITDWRQRWGEGNFPFLFVQLANYVPPNPNFAELRNSQLKTLELPNTGMAAAYDVGNPKDIHPQDKMDVGQRLALVARHVAYGETLTYTGPIYDKMTVTGNKVRVDFTQLGGGLVIGSAPWVPDGGTPLPTTSLLGFTLAGADNKFVPADAVIDGNSVVVSSANVPQPVAVRYAFANDIGTGNLYDKEGLPAIPFRSDMGAEAPNASTTPAPAVPAPVSAPVTK